MKTDKFVDGLLHVNSNKFWTIVCLHSKWES